MMMIIIKCKFVEHIFVTHLKRQLHWYAENNKKLTYCRETAQHI